MRSAPQLDEERSSPAPRNLRARGRRTVTLSLVTIGLVVAAVLIGSALREPQGTVLQIGDGKTIVVPNYPNLSPLRRQIVRIAESQIGYTTDPANTYCNKFSAYWYSGATDCGNSNRDEEWCADFAAWAWQQAGANVVYQYLNGDLNSSSASFYEWGVDHGTWHPASSNYVPQPGDVAVYGLDVSSLVAAHVAVVIGDVPGSRGPIAINGDGDHTGFSVVETQSDESQADTGTQRAALSGYVSPGAHT